MVSDLIKEMVVDPISTGELERRWKATREVMKAERIDFLLIQNNNDYLGGYVKWFTDVPASGSYPVTVIFPVADEMTNIAHGPSDPQKAAPAAWLFRGVKKRISNPIMLSCNYTCTYHAESVVQELSKYRNSRISFVNEGQIPTGFTRYVREHLTGATFVDITDKIDEIKAIKSPEELDHIRYTAYMHDRAMKACIEAVRPGIKEFEVSAVAKYTCSTFGSAQQIVLMGSGPAGKPFPRTNPVHALNRELKYGDQLGLLIEASGSAGLWTHIYRIICIGKQTEELQKCFEDAKALQSLAAGMLKPGADPLEITRVANEFLKSRGHVEETRLFAHGQGYDCVERPSFQPGETMKIKAGMNIGIHPWIPSEKACGRICDNYIVKETGPAECLSGTPREVFVV
jgi:Xaa-Pro aminopeptidase